MHPNYKKYMNLYNINELAFMTQTDLINSNHIQTICPPFQSFTDKKNKRGGENYKRYLLLGNYISNPKICLDSALGIINKGVPEVNLPDNLSKIVDYATIDGTDLTTVQNQIIASIFKYRINFIKNRYSRKCIYS